jgi:hypothetical protein
VPVVFAISLLLFVYCVVDLVTTPASLVRTLPKPLWFFVLIPPVIGPLAWLLGGRPARGTPRPAAPPRPAPGRGAPDDDEDFLRELRRRADDQRRRARDPRDDVS